MTRATKPQRNLLNELHEGDITFAQLTKERVAELGGNVGKLIADSNTNIKLQQLLHFTREDSAWLGIGDYDGIHKFALVLKYDVDKFLDAYIAGYNRHHQSATTLHKSIAAENAERSRTNPQRVINTTSAPNLKPANVISIAPSEAPASDTDSVERTYTEENIHRNLISYRCSELRKKHGLSLKEMSQETGEHADMISAVIRASAPIVSAERLLHKLMIFDQSQQLASVAD